MIQWDILLFNLCIVIFLVDVELVIIPKRLQMNMCSRWHFLLDFFVGFVVLIYSKGSFMCWLNLYFTKSHSTACRYLDIRYWNYLQTTNMVSRFLVSQRPCDTVSLYAFAVCFLPIYFLHSVSFYMCVFASPVTRLSCTEGGCWISSYTLLDQFSNSTSFRVNW